jgi:hypothetical protein
LQGSCCRLQVAGCDSFFLGVAQAVTLFVRTRSEQRLQPICLSYQPIFLPIRDFVFSNEGGQSKKILSTHPIGAVQTDRTEASVRVAEQARSTRRTEVWRQIKNIRILIPM